ncbi:hypothetical protein BH10BAC2_BH10BAC2_21910 [soil metagenome]
MKIYKQSIIVTGAALLILCFISWSKTGTSSKSGRFTFSNPFSANHSNFPWVTENEIAAFTGDAGYEFDRNIPGRLPVAEDVLVQKIQGDNNHLLIMAVYSFERYSGSSLEVPLNGEKVVLRDDGQGFDKVAGDGVFTAKIAADVNEFRNTAMKMQEEMKKSGPQPEFFNRELVSQQSCIRGTFDASLLDNNQAVSIAGLTSGTNDLIDSVRRNCIFITDLAVIEDPARTWNSCTQTGNIDGAWTFKTLMKNLAKQSANIDPSDATLSTFVLNWLKNWQNEKFINQDTVPVRPLVTAKVITPWLARSRAAGAPAGQLDMRFAPFKLTSIVNRFDIRERASGIPAGEGRYTFCLIDSTCTKALQMTIVMEYAINEKDICDSLQDWARQWFNLKNFTLGSPQYNTALQAITDQYSLWGNSNKTSGIGLNSVRTNEIEFAPEDGTTKRYEFREFGLSTGITRKLSQRTVAQIPKDKYNAQVDNPDVRLMVKFVNDNRVGIINDDYTVPDTLTGGIPFLGGHAQILGEPVGTPPNIYHWNGIETKSPARIKNTTARHIFSRNTCTGCHAGEVQTFFTHVDPVFFGTPATLSGFLTGTAGRGGAVDFDNNPANDSMMVRDAAGRGSALNSLRMFNDILRRAKDLKDFVLAPPCATSNVFAIRNELMFKPLGAVH